MDKKTITIHVTTDAARVYEAAPAEDQRKLDALLSLKLSEMARRSRSFAEVMDEVSDTAQSHGMTPEILAEILSE
jgi:hypothetical protein